MKKRSKGSVTKNILAITLYQLVSIGFGLFIPGLILNTYGANAHGIVSTVTNVSQYMILLNAGILNVAMNALYKPFVNKDYHRINEVYNATRNCNRRVGTISLMVTCGLSVLIALVVQVDGIGYFDIMLLAFVMGMQQVLDRYLLCSYQIIIQADQRMYIVYLVNTVTYAIRSVIQICLIKMGMSIALVQAIPAGMMIVGWFIFRLYVRRHYSFLDRNVPADDEVLKNRTYALPHAISGLIVNNSNVIWLTLFCGQIAVSIYSIYNLVISHLHSVIITVFSRSALTNMGKICKTESLETVRKEYSRIEFIFCFFVTWIYSICVILINPFVELYTSGQNEVEYVNWSLSILIILFAIFNGLREPAILMIDANAYYKQTRKGSIIESILTLVIACVGTKLYGVSGVMLGLVVAFVYRYIDVMRVVNHQILKQSSRKSFRRGVQSVVMIAIFSVCLNMFNFEIENWIAWILSGAFLGVVSFIYSVLVYYVTDREDIQAYIRKIKR